MTGIHDNLPLGRIIEGDVLAGLRSLPDGSVQCVVTSPPYWGLRCYGVDGRHPDRIEPGVCGHGAGADTDRCGHVRGVVKSDPESN